MTYVYRPTHNPNRHISCFVRVCLSEKSTRSEAEAHDYEYSVQLAAEHRAIVERARAVMPQLVATGFAQHALIDGLYWPTHDGHAEHLPALEPAVQVRVCRAKMRTVRLLGIPICYVAAMFTT